MLPNADGAYGAGWTRQGCPANARFACVDQRPPNPSINISNEDGLTRASFCSGDPVAAGVAGPVIGVKTIASMRESPEVPAPAGIFLRTGGCGGGGPVDRPEVPVDVAGGFGGFARLDETNPATGNPWSVDDITATEFAVRHPNAQSTLIVDQLALEVIYDPNAPTALPSPPVTLTATPTRTTTPTVTETTTPTATQSPPPSEAATATFTLTRTRTRTRTVTPTPTDTALTPVDTPTASVTASRTNTPVIGTPTDTPEVSPTSSVTRTATATITPTPTGPTPTRTNTIPVRTDYIFASGVNNNWECTLNFSLDLDLSGSVRSLVNLDNVTENNPNDMHNLYLSVWVAPALGDADYAKLTDLSSAPSENRPEGGFIYRFVELGGLAVINVAADPSATPTSVTRRSIAPLGVGYQPPLSSASEIINMPQHPFITGEGYGGLPLSTISFDDWGPSDRGYLTNLPPGATILLRNSRGPTLIEYIHGAGKVIVSTLPFCTPSQAASSGDALSNLLEYGRFFRGNAQTPLPTVTSTPTPSATPTGLATRTSTRTRTPLVTATSTNTPLPLDTPTATPVSCVADCDGNGSVSISELVIVVNISLGARDLSDCPSGDVAGGDPSGPDGEITVDELIRAVNKALNGCG